jgi:hypothetical protein
MTAGVVHLLAENKGVELPLPPWAIGISAFLGLVVLLLITLTFGKDR